MDNNTHIPIKIIIAYDGSRFEGSAIQPKKKTVQGEIEQALKKLGSDGKTNFSGRTDKGVHSTYQVVTTWVPYYWKDLERLHLSLQKMVDSGILIKKIEKTTDQFHARFSAKKRAYRYFFSCTRLTPFNNRYLAYHPDLDLTMIQDVIGIFEGTYDFEYFSKRGSEPKSTIRTIYSAQAYRYKDMIVLRFVANSYLRSQIRLMVGAILAFNDHLMTKEELQEQLAMKRCYTKRLAPAEGLYLSRVWY